MATKSRYPKHFGFITRADSGNEIFVHASDVLAGRALREGDQVGFDLTQDKKGRVKAEKVRLLDAT